MQYHYTALDRRGGTELAVRGAEWTGTGAVDAYEGDNGRPDNGVVIGANGYLDKGA